MTFEEFLEMLPGCPGADDLPLKARNGSFGYAGEGLPEFIGPDLSPSNAITQPDNPRVMIISAAGAVGKSTLAREVAYRKKAPLWDLAQSTAVGENSVTGQITTSFGFALANRVNTKLMGGELFLIIDALDEARVKANEAGFEAFVENIAEIAKEATGTAFVLLSRTQTALWTWLLLDDAGVSASLNSIQTFTREQAERYIEARIQHSDATAARRIGEHKQPFLEARDLILDHLQRAVVGEEALTDEAAREFLGYAPVLETVAVLLTKEGNYHETIKNLNLVGKQSREDLNKPLAVLAHVVTRLLEREQSEKLQFNIKPALEKVAAENNWSAWDELYTPEEQIARLLGRILDRRFDACPDMPAPVRALYEEKLEAWFPEHPFLREGVAPSNKVFESYLFANAMREYMTPLSRFVEERVMAREYKPSRLLADFYILLGEKRGEEIIAERQIGILYDSLLAGETDSLRVRLSIEAGDPDEPEEEDADGEGEFELVYASSEQPDRETVEVRSFKIAEGEGVIGFRRQLKEASVVTRGSVSLGGDVDDFEIGPSVQVRCKRLQIHSSGVVVRGAGSRVTGSEAVLLDAHECDSAVSRKPLVRGSLTVCWPNCMAYPWTECGVEFIPVEGENQHLQETYRRLRRIVTSLQSHSRGSLARVKDKIEHRRVVKNDVGRALLARLRDDGIMVLKGKFYHWVPERGDEALGSSYDDFLKKHITEKIRVYLNAFIEQNPNLF